MINKVILVGRLTADPEVRATAGGVQVANLRLATNTYGGKDEAGNRKEYAEFHRLQIGEPAPRKDDEAELRVVSEPR